MIEKGPVSKVGDVIYGTTGVILVECPADELSRPSISEAPFLPGTILKKGARGKTFQALRARMHLLYRKGCIRANPNELPRDRSDLGTMKGLEAAQGVQTWECVKEYVEQGCSCKDKAVSGILRTRAAAGNYNVNKDVWESLKLPVGNKLSDFFTIDNRERDRYTTINVKLIDNTIIIEYRVAVYIERWVRHPPRNTLTRTGMDTGGRSERVHLSFLANEDHYASYIQRAIDGVGRWARNTPQIQGITPIIEINIYDKDGRSFSGSVTGANADRFTVPSKGMATISIEEDYTGALANMVPDAFFSGGWKKDKKLQTLIRNRNQSADASYTRLIEHEFGHVLGLFDSYGYSEQIPIIGNVFFPPAIINDGHVVPNSVMLSDWDVKDSRNNPLPWVRTATDLAMILYAWQENRLQCYIDNRFFKQSQAYFHMGEDT